MRYRPYTNYKDTSVEWLDKAPEQWEIKRLGSNFTQRKEKVSDKDFEPLSVTKQGILPQLAHVAKSDASENRKLVRKGDYVINSRSDRKGSSGISNFDGSVSLINIVLEPNDVAINPDYCHHLLRSYLFQEEFYKYGHGIVADLWTTNYDDMKNIYLAIPPMNEQENIATFLNKELSKIDNLISKQQQLIHLLDEQRKSVISHAVTKGLNTNAPMKDSGIKWLGRIPEHWGLKRLDSTTEIVRGNSSFSKGDLLETGDYVALQYGKTYKEDEINESFSSYVNHDFFKESQVVQNGDVILVSTSETLKDLGHSCFYGRYDIGLIGGEQFLLKPNKEEILGKYLYYTTKAFSQSLQIYATGTKVFRFNSQVLKTVYIPYISLEEQQKIIDYLDYKCSKIDLLVSKQKNLIEKLKEYRPSIISHAVTGKIDVRESL